MATLFSELLLEPLVGFVVLVHILQFPYLTLACATVRLAIYQTPCVQFFTFLRDASINSSFCSPAFCVFPGRFFFELLIGLVPILLTLRARVDYCMHQSQLIRAAGTRRLHRVKYRFHLHFFILPFCLSTLLLSLFVDR